MASGARTAVVVVVALSVVVGSEAFTSTTLDRSATLEVVGDAENFLGLASHSGPNGVYAHESAGKLVLDFGGTNPNVGPGGSIFGATGQAADAVTTVEDVFNVTNQGTQPVRVWVDDGSAAVAFTTTTDGHGSIDGEVNAITVVPGQTIEVGLTVDSAGAAVGDVLLDGITINAAAEGADAPDVDPDPDPDPSPDQEITLLIGAPQLTVTNGAPGKVYVLTSPVSGTVSLANADATLTGERTDDTAGISVAIAGDVNGDGETDYVVGASNSDEGGQLSTGAAYIVYGPAVPGTLNLTNADVTLAGPGLTSPTLGKSPARAGTSVAGVGDVNGDGFDDVLVGAPGDDDAAAYLVYGSASLPATGELVNAPVTFVDEAFGDAAGQSVAGVGDVNGDDFDDLLIGAPQRDDVGTNEGTAYLVYGSASLPAMIDLANADATFVGEDSFDSAGASVAGAGDVNGDGFDDIVVGAPLNDNAGGVDAGAAYVVYGGSGTDAPAGTLNLAAADLKLEGDVGGETAGTKVGGAGDVDGDGYDDVLVGAPGNDATDPDVGVAYLVYGSPAASVATTINLDDADFTIAGEATDDGLGGGSVVGVGDVNLDGLDDFVVTTGRHDTINGADAGAVYLFYGGSLSGRVSAATADAKLVGQLPGDFAGTSAAGGA